jgi:hypothetical protein
MVTPEDVCRKLLKAEIGTKRVRGAPEPSQLNWYVTMLSELIEDAKAALGVRDDKVKWR